MKATDAILAQIDAMQLQLRALRESVANTDEHDDMLDVRQALGQFGIGRDGLLARERAGEIALTRGPRNKILVSRHELEKLLSRPHVPTRPRRPRRRDAEVIDYDTLVERDAARELTKRAG